MRAEPNFEEAASWKTVRAALEKEIAAVKRKDGEKSTAAEASNPIR
jgi:hypothetical protein